MLSRVKPRLDSGKMVPSTSKSDGMAFRSFIKMSRCLARPSARFLKEENPATLALTMHAPAQSFGNFTRFPVQANPAMKHGLNDGWKDRSGNNVWGWYLTLDEKSGTLYMPFGSPAGNYWGGDRPGTNLFGNSVVAVDAVTGKMKWYFQTVHHDLWDSDLPPAPVLFDIKQNGKTVPALAAINKQAWMFILNRETGKPVFGVEERPVPAGDAPGEWYSPTQPFPLKPPALARTSFKKEDIVTAEDTTPEHAKACMELYEKAGGFYNAGPFTPFLYHEEGTPPRSTIIFPGNGGPNWGGMAADPQIRLRLRSNSRRRSERMDREKAAGW